MFTILAYLPHHHQLYSAPQPMTTGHQRQLYSSSQANDTSLFGTPSALWHPICLMVPQMPHGAPHAFLVPTYAFRRPICLLQAPCALWDPTCLFCTHICLWAPRLPFASPICLLAPHFFLEKTHDKLSGSQKGPWF
jgi:hypothetical protein